MTLRLERGWPRPDGTPGVLFVDGMLFCDTLENPPGKDKGPIPAGSYPVEVTWSDRFQRDLPLVQDVPGFTGIRLHPGNTDADTTGCILLGHAVGGGQTLADSRATVADLLVRWGRGPATLDIVDAPASTEV